MFKKSPQTKALSNLKSSERRRMLANIEKLYNLPEGLSKETEEKFLPPTIKQATFVSPQEFSGTIYTDDDQTPVWFKTKDSELIPTVYTLWRAPFLLNIVHTHPHVIEVLEGGANLMLPGTVPPFSETIKRGQIVGVADTQDPYLIRAIGRAAQDLAGIDKVVGTTGVAVTIYHTTEDMLYQLSKQKIKAPKELDLTLKFKELEIDSSTVDSEEPITSQHPETIKPAEDTEDPNEDKVNEEFEPSDEVSLTTEDIDNFFKRSLFQTLTQSQIQYTITASNFMDKVNANLPSDHPSIQIKKTSWKKSAKFLKAMEKEGFLKLKGKGDDVTIVSAATKENNEDLKTFVPYKVKSRQAQAKSKNTKDTSSQNENQLILHKLYKPASSLRQIFNDLDLVFSDFYSSTEIRDILNKYIAKNNLVNERNKKSVLLDEVLSNVIPGQTTVGRDKILEPVLKKCSEYYKLERPGEEEGTKKSQPTRGQVPQVQVITETKIGRKLITRTSNFEVFGVPAEEFSNELKVKCSGSSTIGKNVQNPKLTEVTVQGPHSKIVIDLLTNKYGLNKNWIKFEDKSRPKKKKPIV